MTGQPAPNWYDDRNGNERWWNGRAWTQYTRPLPNSAVDGEATAVLESQLPAIVAATVPAAAPDAAPRSIGRSARPPRVGGLKDRVRARTRRPSKRVLIPLMVGLVAFLIGTGTGHGDAAPAAVEPTTTPAFSKLETALSAMTAQRDGLQQKVDAAAAATSDLETRTAELDTRKSDLDAQQKKLDARSKKLDKREAKLASASASTSTDSSPVEAAPTSVYYANCTAARAAGAAPVRVGDPGYSRKLDRDGDGVGCE